MLQRSGRLGHHLAAGADLAGERHLGDARVAAERLADAVVALDDVEQPGRYARLGVDLGQLDRRERGELGRLEHHRVAAGEGRRRLPAGDLQRVVPGADAGAHAERLAPRVAPRAAEVDVLAVERCRQRRRSTRCSRRPTATSTAIASAIGLPVSATSSAASSSLRSAQQAHGLHQDPARGLRRAARATPRTPARAERTAASTSASDACCTSPSTSPVAGLMVGNVSPDVPSTARPPMNWRDRRSRSTCLQPRAQCAGRRRRRPRRCRGGVVVAREAVRRAVDVERRDGAVAAVEDRRGDRVDVVVELAVDPFAAALGDGGEAAAQLRPGRPSSSR